MGAQQNMALWRSWLARRPVTAEVAGSSPVRVAIFLAKAVIHFMWVAAFRVRRGRAFALLCDAPGQAGRRGVSNCVFLPPHLRICAPYEALCRVTTRARTEFVCGIRPCGAVG